MLWMRRWCWSVVVALALAGCGGGKPRPTPAPRPERTPAQRTDPASVAARADVPVLCYHQIRPPTSGDGDGARPYIVAPAVFSKQMAALAAAGFHTITGDELVAYVARGARLPSKPVLLTFDDASAGQFTHALPVLRRHRFVATFFVMTVVLDKPGWLTRRQVRALDRAGMTIGAHTWDHSAVPGYADADWAKQIDEPTHALERLVGHPVRLFAYPFGLWDAAAIPHLWHAGLRAAFQLGERLDRRHPLWNLRRIIVPDWTGRELRSQIARNF
jgi:peptidoglycan/xylan/chitin deacetylase (PgdA/CDA1 family)